MEGWWFNGTVVLAESDGSDGDVKEVSDSGRSGFGVHFVYLGRHRRPPSLSYYLHT